MGEFGVWPNIEVEPCSIPEYADNPFINRLPAIPSEMQIFEHLNSMPMCLPHERNWPAHIRQQLIFIRCKSLFFPIGPQLRQAFRLDMLLRAGYCGRNPSSGDFVRRLTALRTMVDKNGGWKDPDEVGAAACAADKVSADSMAIIGPSGIGKTTTLRRALFAYPQVIKHSSPASIHQIVWLLLDCPSGGSPKQLCLAFFQAVDELLGTKYEEKFGRLTTDHMLVKAAHVAAIHALGLLAIDEIQNLTGQQHVLSFLTSLVNVVNVPVVMIGTMKAYNLLTQCFRTARRGEGAGSFVFEPMSPGLEWDTFLQMLFRFQWTKQHTELTPEINATLWEQSQGIIDIVVKLFMLSQMRAIRTAERSGRSETITPKLINTVSAESFKLVRPMLDALRRKDWVALARYDDLLDLDTCIARTLSKEWGEGGAPDLTCLAAEVTRRLDGATELASQSLVAMLTSSGLEDAEIRDIVERVGEARAAKHTSKSNSSTTPEKIEIRGTGTRAEACNKAQGCV